MKNWLGAAVLANVQDFWFSELRAGRCFGRSTNLGIVAAQGGMIQLFNPVGSGVEALVYLAYAELDIAQPWAMFMSEYNTQATTDVGTGFNLLSGGAASVCHLRSQVTAQTVDGSLMRQFSGRANGPEHELALICELPPGKGLLLETTNPSATMYGAFRWREGS